MKYAAFVYNGRYIMGDLVLETEDRDAAIAAVSAAARKRFPHQYTPEIRVEAERAPTDPIVPQSLMAGSVLVWDCSPLPGPRPMGLVQRVPTAEELAQRAPPPVKKAPPPLPPALPAKVAKAPPPLPTRKGA